MIKKSSRGFTLIELLVVIAIIGILSSVVLASLNTARQKSRDARRIADIKQLQLALELYFDSKATYPSSTSQLVPTYISILPKDPLSSAAYTYVGVGPGAVATCSSYHLMATLEQAGHTALGADADNDGTPVACTDGGTNVAGTDPIYDVIP